MSTVLHKSRAFLHNSESKHVRFKWYTLYIHSIKKENLWLFLVLCNLPCHAREENVVLYMHRRGFYCAHILCKSEVYCAHTPRARVEFVVHKKYSYFNPVQMWGMLRKLILKNCRKLLKKTPKPQKLPKNTKETPQKSKKLVKNFLAKI